MQLRPRGGRCRGVGEGCGGCERGRREGEWAGVK
jgi:hypothetical protein